MLRGVLLIFAVFVAVDCSLLRFGLVSVDHKALPQTAVTSTKVANTKCACQRQCVKDKTCTGVTTFVSTSGSFECHFSSAPNTNGSRLEVVDSSRLSVSTLLKVAEPTSSTTPQPTTTTSGATTTSITTANTTKTEPPCPSSYERITGLLGCFFISVDEKNFAEAELACKNIGGELASLAGVGELQAMMTHLVKITATDDYFLNLFQKVPENVFMWGDNSKFISSAKWASDEPNMLDTDHCVRMKKINSFRLATIKCSDSYHYICRK